MKPVSLVFALSIHAILEGISMGLIDEWQDAMAFGFAILCHSWAESVSIGTQL